MLTSRITLPVTANPETEDIFYSALGTLFTDDTQISHGTPGSHVIYNSPRFGKIILKIPIHPDVEDGRKLFAHYLWNAGVIAADAIEQSSTKQPLTTAHEANSSTQWDPKYWDFRGKQVLELGAGTALPSIISALSGAASVVVTDHPSSPALTSGAIEQNINENLLASDNEDETRKPRSDCAVSVYGYTWGTRTMYLTDGYGRPASHPLGPFDRMVIADCLWMPSQHGNLVQSIMDFLDASKQESYALVVAGFHTGRRVVVDFFEVAVGSGMSDVDCLPDEVKGDSTEITTGTKGRLEVAEIFEIDVDGVRREWVSIRQDETKEQLKRWCVCAVLRRKLAQQGTW